jgi:phosphohistidine swiveling domain-containing protein
MDDVMNGVVSDGPAAALERLAELPERWITDTRISQRFPYYTRANADEVGPLPFSPLGWSLAWEQGCLPGVARGFVDFGVVDFDEYDLDPPQMFGNWGGYFYNPMSLSRLMGVRMPGATAEAIDKAYFGDHPGVPPYEAHPDDENPAATAKLAETMAWVMSTDCYPKQEQAESMARAIVAARPDFDALSSAELVAYARSMAPLIVDAWTPYAVVCLAASLGPGAVQAICAAVGRADDAVTVLGAIDNVESAGAAFAMWDLSRMVRRSAHLTTAFDSGVDGALETMRLNATDHDVAAFLHRWEDLLAQHGHRGPNEWDARPDSWTTRPEMALGMIDRLRHQDDHRSPHVARRRAVEERQRITTDLLDLVAADPQTHAALDAAIRSAALFLAMRERGKYACIRLIHEIKLAINALGTRMVAAGVVRDRHHVFNLLDNELDDFVRDPDAFRDVLARRERAFAALHDVEPPYIVGHVDGVAPIHTWKRRRTGTGAGDHAGAGYVLRGGPGAPGRVRGTARIVLDPAQVPEDLGGDDILVAPTTDPSWVPLFLAVRGVVVNVGAIGSHAAIVCREIGVPCVVSVIAATDRIAEGATVEIDGSTGTVTILG